MIYRTLYQGLAILIAFFMATTVSIVSVSSDDKVKPSNNPVSGWTELIGDAGLTAVDSCTVARETRISG